jgi:hypothetical protein
VDQVSQLDINWINRFKSRRGIVSKKLHGEAAAVNPVVVENWKENVLPVIRRQFKDEDIFNSDETGLFWKMMPNSTLVRKNETCAGGKRAKDRVTVLVGASAAGEKLPLLIIGRFGKPRCFKNSTIPLEYMSNRKAWMTGDIFSSYLKKMDRQMRDKNRKIALILDNCSAHPHIGDLTNISLYFLPPNTTSMIQPMDAGIIKNLKHYYRQDLVKKKIRCLDNSLPFSIDLLQALIILEKAWREGTQRTIVNCFKHVGFTARAAEIEIPDIVEIEGFLVEGDDTELDPGLGETSMQDYIDVDMYLATFETVIPDVGGEHSEEHGEVTIVDDSDSDEELPAVTVAQAVESVATLERFMAEQDEGFPFIQELERMRTFILRRRDEQLRQSDITQYFVQL